VLNEGRSKAKEEIFSMMLLSDCVLDVVTLSKINHNFVHANNFTLIVLISL
jgi:hypothetical protein